MAHNHSYPSPNAAQMGEGPFFASQNQMPAPQDPLQGRPVHAFNHAHIASQQLAQSSLESTEGSARKRTKVSRACDECRRKKIRCDAASEEAGAQCSSCKRAEIVCQFSRQPQKRGPSKGYIKELSTRVEALENNKVISRQPSLQYSPYSPQAEELRYTSNKRTHSMSEGLYNPADMDEGMRNSERPVNWLSGGDEATNTMSPIHNTYENTMNLPTTNHPASYTTQAYTHQDMAATGVVTDLQQPAIDEYYRVIHPTLPILPNSIQQLSRYVGMASEKARKAFVAAFHTLPRQLAPAMGNGQASMSPKLKVADAMLEGGIKSFLDGIICLQAILLLIIIPTMRVQEEYDPEYLYHLAVSLVTVLGLGSIHRTLPVAFGPAYAFGEKRLIVSAAEITRFGKLAQRTWLAFTVVESWTATAQYIVGRAKPETDHRLFRSDKDLIGDTGFLFVRLSLVLNDISDAIRDFYLNGPDFHKKDAMQCRKMSEYLDLFRDYLESMENPQPHVHLAFLHVKHCLTYFHMIHMKNGGRAHHAQEVVPPVDVALQIVATLCRNDCPLSPWTEHVTSVAMKTLLSEHTRGTYPGDPVPRALQDLSAWLQRDDNPMATAPGTIGDLCNLDKADYIARSMADIDQQAQEHSPVTTNGNAMGRGGLQHLADAAVGNVETSEEQADLEEAAQASRT